jgi:hypothetical protein
MKFKKICLFLITGFFLFLPGAYFFLFTDTGIGLIAFYDNWKKGDPVVPLENEIVMSPDATITAKTESGTITIKSGKGLKRYYSWNGVTRSVVMWPRTCRWYGSFGLYYPGPGSHWLPNHEGVSRGVLDEGQQHFDTQEEAIVWLKKQNQDCVYNDNGLVVCFSINLGREQINVDVWQIYIGGDKTSKQQEDDFHQKAAEIFGKTLEKEEIEQIYGWRNNKIYHTGGSKPVRLEGSNNNAIKTSWGKS